MAFAVAMATSLLLALALGGTGMECRFMVSLNFFLLSAVSIPLIPVPRIFVSYFLKAPLL